MTTIALGSRLCHRARLHIPWAGRPVLRVWFSGAPPSGKVTVQWGNTPIVGTVIPSRSGESVGEGMATIVCGAGWHEIPPAKWLVDASAAPARVAQQLAQAVGETLALDASALAPGSAAFARAAACASDTLRELLASGALWWVELGGTTRAAAARTSPVLSVQVLEYHPDARTARLSLLEPTEAPIGGVIPAATDRHPELRIYGLDIEAHEGGIFATAQLAPPTEDALERRTALLVDLSRQTGPDPYATLRGAAVQSQDVQRRVSLRLEQRDRELDDALPVPAWCGVPGVSAEVYSGTLVKLAFDRADASRPLAALWSPYNQAGHVPRKVYHEAAEEVRFVLESAGSVRVGVAPSPVALATNLVAYLQALETWALSIDLAIAPAVALLTPPQQAAYSAAVSARTSAAGNVASIPATRLEAE